MGERAGELTRETGGEGELASSTSKRRLGPGSV